MKSAISLPDDLGIWFDQVAERHGMNRSEFYRRAGERYAKELEAQDLTTQINVAVDAVGSQSSDGARLARALIDSGKWEW